MASKDMQELSHFARVALEKSTPVENPGDVSGLIKQIKDKKIVMLGEATHGTQEFYEWRRLISQELIQNHGFSFIAVEGDWPPCEQADLYIHHQMPGNARTVLQSFTRWPTWMWANTEVMKLVEWMKWSAAHGSKAGFHGLDVYSLFESMQRVIEQLKKISPDLAEKARQRYGCFDPYQRDEKEYARSLFADPEGCEEKVIHMLQDVLKLRLENSPHMRAVKSSRAVFSTEQNARIVLNAEKYYRAMIQGNDDSWNVRDRHMMETLDLLLEHYGPDSKAIVWEHNTHIGDYRATDMVAQGQVNIGGLAREKYGRENVALVGFTTYEGTVIAGKAWDAPAEVMEVPKGRPESVETELHRVAQTLKTPQFILDLTHEKEDSVLNEERGQRAIGVVYRPAHERWGNYVPTLLAKRYDHFFFIDQTHALKPISSYFDIHKFPETWPMGNK